MVYYIYFFWVFSLFLCVSGEEIELSSSPKQVSKESLIENEKLLGVVASRKTIPLWSFCESLARIKADLITEEGYNSALQAIFEKSDGVIFQSFSKEDERIAYAKPMTKWQQFSNRLKHVFLPHLNRDGKDPNRGTQAEYVKAIVTQLGLDETGKQARFALYPRTVNLLRKGQFGHLFHRQRKTKGALVTGAVGHSLVEFGKSALSMYEAVAVAVKYPAIVPVGVLVLGSEGGIHATSQHRHISHTQRAIEILSAVPMIPAVINQVDNSRVYLNH